MIFYSYFQIFLSLCLKTTYIPRKIPTISCFVPKMILNRVTLLVTVLVQGTFVLGSDGATTTIERATATTTGILQLSILHFVVPDKL